MKHIYNAVIYNFDPSVYLYIVDFHHSFSLRAVRCISGFQFIKNEYEVISLSGQKEFTLAWTLLCIYEKL